MDRENLTPLQESALLKLRGVIDPELMVNIVDLGLVYDIRLHDETLEVDVTLTSPGCPLGDMIMQDIKAVLDTHYPEHEVEVNLVWEPAWSTEMINESGKAALNRFGN
jgi:metal-sulfur cluster biosynthetic enzyme